MRKLCSLLISCLLASYNHAQTSFLLPSSTAIAGTSVSDLNHWSSFHNPAPLSNTSSAQLSAQVESRYIITELSTKSLSIVYPTDYFVSGVAFSYYGFSLYHEMIVGLAFAREFSERFSIGVQFNYLTTYYQASNSYHGAFFPQVGINFPLSKTFQLGFHVFNPFHTNITTDITTKRLPAIFSLGYSYDLSNKLIWRFQSDKEFSSNYRFATAFDYYLMDNVRFQVGVYGYEYLIPCLGFGYKFKQFDVDLNSELHPLLGLTTLAHLKFSFLVK